MSATQPVLDFSEVIIDTSLLRRLLSANNDALVTRSRPIRMPVFAPFQLSRVINNYNQAAAPLPVEVADLAGTEGGINASGQIYCFG